MTTTGTPSLIPLGIFTVTVQLMIYFGLAQETPGRDGKHDTVWHDKSVDQLTPYEYKHDTALFIELRRGNNTHPYFEGNNVAGGFQHGDGEKRLQVRILFPIESSGLLPAGYIVETLDGKYIAFIQKYKMDSIIASAMADPRRPRMTRSQVRQFLA